MPDRTPPLVVVVGPTASGKSALGVALGRALGGEVVNGDSMQLYRGMDVGTAKIGFDERHGVPHHLLDVLDIAEPSTVAEFQWLARASIADCRSRDVTPILVGGSALYVRAVVDDFEFPGSDPQIRARLERELETGGLPQLRARLARIDPAAAASIEPSNARRIVRALEVNELTGGPFRATLPPHRSPLQPLVMLGLDVPRPVLDERIALRVDRMWADGFVDEVRGLADLGLRVSRTASRALGYQQLLAALDDVGPGEQPERERLESARLETVQRTRRFARRQDSWFRKDERIHWLPFDAPDLVDRALGLVSSTAVPSTL